MKKIKPRRLFFALWPDDNTRQAITTTFKRLSADLSNGHIIQPANLHLTLHFIGNTSETKMHCLARQAEKVRVNKFTVTLNHYGYFKKPEIIWMGLKQKPPSLEELYRKLAREFAECDYHPDNRDYSPHISLIRKIARPDKLDEFEPIKWQIKEFVLVESLTKNNPIEYSVIQQYPLF